MKMVLICLLSVVASAQVEVTRLAKDDPATGLKFVTVLLAVKGDKPYSDDPAAAPAELGVMCQQRSLGKQKQQDVSMTLGTGVVARTGFPVPDPSLLLDRGLIATLVRLDEQRPRQLEWQKTADPHILIRNDFKFVRDHIFTSKMIRIEVTGTETRTHVSSFDLSRFKEEYSRHPECKR